MSSESENCRGRERVWSILVGVFFVMAVWPLWSARFPAMQDYPQHLFQTEVLHSYNNPAFDYRRYFVLHVDPVYLGFFLPAYLLSQVLPIEIAGKISLSIYPLLIAILVLRLGRRKQDMLPWGALLFFPLACNQVYYLGFLNYFLALPLLFLALLDFDDYIASPLGKWSMCRQLLWMLAVFTTHPLVFDIYVSFAAVAALMARRRSSEFKFKTVAMFGAALLLLAASWLIGKLSPAAESAGTSGMTWLPIRDSVSFFAMMFDGMHDIAKPDFVQLSLWGCVLAVVVGALVADKRKAGFPIRHVIFLALSILAFVVLPFGIGSFTYINVRIAPIVYFFGALLVAEGVRFRGWWLYLLIALTGLCMVGSAVKQGRISAETNEVLPIVRAIPPNSRILPLVFDNGSPELDRSFFTFHAHDHDYYHSLVGGGFDPYLLRAPLHPVRYRPGQMRPAPGQFEAYQFFQHDYSADYQYFLVRGMPAGWDRYMLYGSDKVCVSGSWELFKRKAH